MTKILEKYREFDHAEDLNAAIRLHLQEHRYKMNPTTFSVFETISRYAVKHGGAAWLKVETLANILGKSKPTIRRAIALLESLGIVERVAKMRPKRGGNGGNIIRILSPQELSDRPLVIAREEAVEPLVSTDQAAKTQNESTTFKSFNNVLTNTWADANVPLYRRMINFVEATFEGSQQKLISKLYGVYKAKQTEDQHIAFEAFKTSVTAYKTGKISNIAGYYSRTIDRMITLKAAPVKTSVRTEMLPTWFTDQAEEVAPIEKDADFLAKKAALEAMLKNRKK